MNGPVVAVVDDDPGVLASMLAMLKAEGFAAVGFDAPAELLLAVATVSIACLITDLWMPSLGGIGLISQLRQGGRRDFPIIVVSGHADVPTAVRAMQMGAASVLEKPCRPAELVKAIRQAIDDVGAAKRSDALSEVRARYQSLSHREREALAHLSTGSSSKVAALALGISPRTVDAFRTNILRKMRAPNMAAVAAQVARLE